MPDILHSEVFPDRLKLLNRKWFKSSGSGTVTAPADATIVVVRNVATGGQGENAGGNAAFARKTAKCTPGEVFQYQNGSTGTGGTAGDSWFRRAATGEMLCYADRGRGTGGVQGAASRCIGDFAESGVPGVRSGGDSDDPYSLGFGGRYAASNPIRAAGPGGGGLGLSNVYGNTVTPAGQGLHAVEFYAAVSVPPLVADGALPGPGAADGELDWSDDNQSGLNNLVL